MSSHNIAFIGGGNMTRALVDGLLLSGYDAERIFISNRSENKLEYFQTEHDIKVSVNNAQAFEWAKIVIVAVKPQHMSELCREISPFVTAEHLIVSVAAGISLNQFKKILPQASIVRAMPNLATSVGKGITGLYVGEHAVRAQELGLEDVFCLLGLVEHVNDETQLAALTVVAASGIAFYCCLSEILQQVAESHGFPLAAVERMIQKTAQGAAAMVGETGISWSRLRDQVTSPGGTTEAALTSMSDAGVREMVSASINLAINKALNIGNNE
jgi:pyrroline-5-carboxylate reductase